MNSKLKTLLQLLLWTGIAIVLLYLTFQGRSWADLMADMREADGFWVLMGAISLLGMMIFRGLRWKVMLDSAGHPVQAGNTILSVIICYMVNSLTPKLGEIARCSVLYRSDKIPVAASLGTVVMERVMDLIFLFAGVGLILISEADRLGELFATMYHNLFGNLHPGVGIGALVLLAAAGIAALLYLRRMSAQRGPVGKVRTFILTMYDAAKSIFRLDKPWLFIFYTLMTWIPLILMNYFFLLALPGTSDLSFYFAFVILVIGGLGWAFPVPAGIGTTHYITLQLFVAFGLSEQAGQNNALLSNGATFVYTIVFGLIAWGLFMLQNLRKPVPAENRA